MSAAFDEAFDFDAFDVAITGADIDISDAVVTTCAVSDTLVTTCTVADVLITAETLSDDLLTTL